MKVFKNIFGVLLLVLSVGMMVSCSRDGDGNESEVIPQNNGGEYYVKATGSNGVIVNVVAIVVDGATHTFQPKTNPYTSQKYNVNSVFAASVSANGVNDKSTLKVELFKGGKVIKTATSNGQYLSATVSN